MHVGSDLTVLYFGTPVVLISSRNEDGSANLAPMSSAWSDVYAGAPAPVTGFVAAGSKAQSLLEASRSFGLVGGVSRHC